MFMYDVVVVTTTDNSDNWNHFSECCYIVRPVYNDQNIQKMS